METTKTTEEPIDSSGFGDAYVKANRARTQAIAEKVNPVFEGFGRSLTDETKQDISDFLVEQNPDLFLFIGASSVTVQRGFLQVDAVCPDGYVNFPVHSPLMHEDIIHKCKRKLSEIYLTSQILSPFLLLGSRGNIDMLIGEKPSTLEHYVSGFDIEGLAQKASETFEIPIALTLKSIYQKSGDHILAYGDVSDVPVQLVLFDPPAPPADPRDRHPSPWFEGLYNMLKDHDGHEFPTIAAFKEYFEDQMMAKGLEERNRRMSQRPRKCPTCKRPYTHSDPPQPKFRDNIIYTGFRAQGLDLIATPGPTQFEARHIVGVAAYKTDAYIQRMLTS